MQDNIPAVGAAGYTLLSELDDLTWDSWLSLADVATAMNTKAASQGAIFANSFTNTYLTYSGIALIFNHANLTAANSALIFNEAGLTAANSAAIFNEAGLTVANSALIFNEAGLTAANSAAIFNEAGLTAANSAAIFNEAGFAIANKALVFREAGLSIANINAIIIHANITDDNAQQILSEITKANRDLTSADNIYELLDDWDDSKLTSRDGAGTTSTGFTNLFAQKDKFRPEWATGAGSPAASGGELVLALSASVTTPSTFVTGTWEWLVRHSATGGNNAFKCYFLGENGDTSSYAYVHEHSGTIVLWVTTDGNIISGGIVTQPTTNKAYKVTRDSSGNFEIFFDGVSKGTATNTRYTSSVEMRIRNAHTAGPTIYVDDLKVY